MKKTFVIATTFLIPLSALAQPTEKTISDIRKQYSAAQSVAKFMHSDEWMENDCHTLTLKSRINYAGGGIVEHDTEILLTRTGSNSEIPDDHNTFRPWLTRETLGGNIVFYREMLFDKTTGELTFCYQCVPLPNSSISELRYYFDNEKLIREVPENGQNVYLSTPDEILSIAGAMKKMIVNYNHVDDR